MDTFRADKPTDIRDSAKPKSHRFAKIKEAHLLFVFKRYAPHLFLPQRTKTV